MRILFFLAYPGYLRYYDSTLELLAERGHQVFVTFEQPGKQAEGLRALDEKADNIIVLERPPKRPPTWEYLPRELRRVVDFARYLDPRFADAHYLRERQGDLMTWPFSAFKGVKPKGPRFSRGLLGSLQSFEQALPSFANIEDFLRELSLDVLVVTPLVTSASRQPDYVKAARSVGVPTVLAVASWDHLSSKGIIRMMPDKVIVWNEIQKREAIELHAVPADRVAVTGAQPWDRWFEQRPTWSAADFRAKVGLPAEKPYILFVGSTASISKPDEELAFVREWVGGLRNSGDARLRDSAVLVRPHPYNLGLWGRADVSDLGDVAVYPRSAANPVDEDDRAVYYDSMYHCRAVVGINTSAMMESAILGRPVFTIRSPRFTDSQGGTVHFNYLLPENGGFVHEARSLAEHVTQLSRTLADSTAARAQTQSFVASFIRPHGLDRPATPFICDEIEFTAVGANPAPVPVTARSLMMQKLMWLVSVAHLGRDGRERAKVMNTAGERVHKRLGSGGASVAHTTEAAANVLRNVERAAASDGRGPLSRVALGVERGGVRARSILVRVGAKSEFELTQRANATRVKAVERTQKRKAKLRAARAAAESSKSSKPPAGV